MGVWILGFFSNLVPYCKADLYWRVGSTEGLTLCSFLQKGRKSDIPSKGAKVWHCVGSCGRFGNATIPAILLPTQNAEKSEVST